MPSTDKTRKTPPAGARTADATVRIKEIERDPGAILRHAAQHPVRVAAKDGTRMFHIATIRRGDKSDPAWPASMPVALAALKRRAGRILHLASGLQISLRVQATRTSASVFFIEPGSECLEFANQRLGGSIRDAALLRNALRRSPIARAAAEAAVKQAGARRQDEVKSLHGRIATLERAAKKTAADKDAEVQSLKSRILVLERAAKKPAAPRRPRPDLEIAPAGAAESGAPGSERA
jgi:hypothetical protein